MQDDMILDMHSFDFNTIVDYDDDNATNTPRSPRVSRGGNDADLDGGFDMDMIEDEDGFDEEFDDEAFDDEDEDDGLGSEFSPTELASRFSDIPDDIELMVGDIKATKADLVNHIRDIDDFKVRKGQLDGYFGTFEQIDTQMNSQFIKNYTETEMKLNSFKQKLNNPQLMDSERGMIYRDIEKLENNKRLINNEVEQYQRARTMRDEQAEQVRLNETNTEMSNRYGRDWATKMAPAITQYVVDSGLASPEIRKALSPALLEMVIKAQKYDNLAKGSKEKVKEASKGKTARSTSSNASKKNQGVKDTKRSSDLRKYNRGQLTGADAWHLIKD